MKNSKGGSLRKWQHFQKKRKEKKQTLVIRNILHKKVDIYICA